MKGLVDANRSRGRSGGAEDGARAGLREAAHEIPLLQAQNLKVFSTIEIGHQRTLPGESEGGFNW